MFINNSFKIYKNLHICEYITISKFVPLHISFLIINKKEMTDLIEIELMNIVFC